MQILSRPESRPENATGVTLINLADDKTNGPGTYRYQGNWETLDQILVTDWLINCTSGISADRKNFKIFKPGFLLSDDPKYPGKSPFSTYRGYRYQGGFSDHLPVILDLYRK
jgi:hypothetical protein